MNETRFFNNDHHVAIISAAGYSVGGHVLHQLHVWTRAAVIRQQESERHVPQERAAQSRREYLQRRGVRLTERAEQLGKWERRVAGWARHLGRVHNFGFDPETIPSRRFQIKHGHEIH